MNLLISLLCLPFAIYLAFNVFYLFTSAVAGRVGRADDVPVTDRVDQERRIGVLIPAYREDAVIIGSVLANLKQKYPSHLYDLIVIADSFLPETLQKLAQYPVQVIPVQFEQSTVQKSIQYALNLIPDNKYDIIVISDADNHMAPDFLTRINHAFDKGWRVVQGHRTAKNTNTSVAVFDALNEEINNTIFRAGQRVLGFPSMLIGSGMAFEPVLIKNALARIQTVSGYDKELEMLLALDGVPIGYLQEAIIYDEKVQNVAVFHKQRTRWIAAQVYFVKAYFKTGIREVGRRNWAAGNALTKAMLLPRMILLGVLGLLLPVSLLTGNLNFMWFTGGLLSLLISSLVVAIPPSLWAKLSIRDFAVLPSLIFGMFCSLLKFRQAGKKFLHTPHAETVESRL